MSPFLPASNGNAVLVKELIALGADKNARTAEGNTPLHEACKTARKKERIDTLRVLVAAGCDPLAKHRVGKTPADIANEHEHADVVPILEEAAKNYTERNKK